MNDIHRTAFEFFQKGIDEGQADQKAGGVLGSHLATCPECQLDVRLYQGLQAEAALHWPEAAQPARSARELLDVLDAQQARNRRIQKVADPIRVAAWIILMVFFVLAINWAIANLRQEPAVTPSPTEEEQFAPPPVIATPTPRPSEGELQKIPLEPFARGGEAVERGIWSPDGSYLFFELSELPDGPLAGRSYSTLNFLHPESGEICQLPQKLLDFISLANLARWLPENRVLFVPVWAVPPEDEPGDSVPPDEPDAFFTGESGVYALTPCDAEPLDLSDRFSEPVFSLPAWNEHGPLFLLQGQSQYWLLDGNTLDARPIENPAPSSGGEDRQSWSPSGEQLAIIQPDPQRYGERSILHVFEVETGQVVRTVEIPYGEEFNTPIIEWLLEDTIYVWAFGEAGPLLVDFSREDPVITAVLPGLFGLDLAYPDEFMAATVAADEAGKYHIAFKVNTPSDKSTYLYHSETGQVEEFTTNANTLFLFPDGDFESLPRAEDEAGRADEFELVWVDDPIQEPELLVVEGHIPRSYPALRPRRVPDQSKIIFASGQGVSVISILGGQLEGFWSLESEGGVPFLPEVSVSPTGEFAVVSAAIQFEDGSPWRSAFYLIRLEP
jgi:hypothetical protein